MGRNRKSPPDESFFIQLEKSDPEAALMQRRSWALGKKIREHRELRRFSVQELAEIMNISVATVNALERGERKPSFEVLYKLLDVFDLEPNDLLLTRREAAPSASGSGDSTALFLSEERAGFNADKNYTAVTSRLKNLSSAERDLAIDIMKIAKIIEK